MTDPEPKPIGPDGLFKLLTWRSEAITRVFGLPDIEGEPLQQEFQFPRERRVDRLYRLVDKSLLNIEHQSSLSDSAPIHNFRKLPVDEFRRSGRLDDLILGLMAAGGDDATYAREVLDLVRSRQGVARRDAMEKVVAVYAMMPGRSGWSAVEGDLDMWEVDLENDPLAKSIFGRVGKKVIAEAVEDGRRRALATLIVRHAVRDRIYLPFGQDETVDFLVSAVSEETLMEMGDALPDMSDFKTFLTRHGVTPP